MRLDGDATEHTKICSTKFCDGLLVIVLSQNLSASTLPLQENLFVYTFRFSKFIQKFFEMEEIDPEKQFFLLQLLTKQNTPETKEKGETNPVADRGINLGGAVQCNSNLVLSTSFLSNYIIFSLSQW